MRYDHIAQAIESYFVKYSDGCPGKRYFDRYANVALAILIRNVQEVQSRRRSDSPCEYKYLKQVYTLVEYGRILEH